MSTKSWKEGDTAHVVIKNPLNTRQLVLRQVVLENAIHKGVWRVSWDDVDDDANVHSVDIALQESKLHDSAEDPIQEITTEFATDLLNEHREWFQEVRPDSDQDVKSEESQGKCPDCGNTENLEWDSILHHHRYLL